MTGSKDHDIGNTKFNAPTQLSQNINNIENAKEQTSYSSCIVKLTAKAKESKDTIASLFWRQSTSVSLPELPPTSEPNRKVKDFIIQLTKLSDN